MAAQHRLEIEGKEIIIETGKLAKQAHGAVTVQSGGTLILATAVCAKEPDEEKDFFPLTVDYRERYTAVGKFPGGYIKRESRPCKFICFLL